MSSLRPTSSDAASQSANSNVEQSTTTPVHSSTSSSTDTQDDHESDRPKIQKVAQSSISFLVDTAALSDAHIYTRLNGPNISSSSSAASAANQPELTDVPNSNLSTSETPIEQKSTQEKVQESAEQSLFFSISLPPASLSFEASTSSLLLPLFSERNPTPIDKTKKDFDEAIAKTKAMVQTNKTLLAEPGQKKRPLENNSSYNISSFSSAAASAASPKGASLSMLNKGPSSFLLHPLLKN